MLIVKPFGRSFVGVNQKKRKLQLNKDTTEKGEKDFSDFNESNPDILIRQWISAIDKIIKKPNQADVDNNQKKIKKRKNNPSKNDKRRKTQLEFRTKLGAACWELLQKKCSEPKKEKYEKIWQWKLHPAGECYANFKNEKYKKDKNGKKVIDTEFELPITGRFYKRFRGNLKLNDVNLEDIKGLADSICEHLHEAEYKIYENFRKKRGVKIGVIAARANSIAQNSLAMRFEKKLKAEGGTKQILLAQLTEETAAPGWNEDDINQLSANDDLARKIYKKQHNSNKVIFRECAGAIISAHYKEQFAVADQVPPRCEIAKTNAGLLALYDAIRIFYKKLLKGKKKRDSLLKILPENDAQLCALLQKRQDNGLTNDLIRYGKVLHYSETKNKDMDYFWSSAGQTEIKRTEAFERIWRHVLSQMARTARALADPNGTEMDGSRPADILSENINLKRALDKNVHDHAHKQAVILLGDRAKEFQTLPPKSFIYSSLRMLGHLRNHVFHFNSVKQFVDKMTGAYGAKGKNYKGIIVTPKDQTIDDNAEAFFGKIKELLEQDQQAQRERIWKICEGAHMPEYAGALNFPDYFALIEKPDDSTIPLPKFNRLLLRIEHAGMKCLLGKNFSFPQEANKANLQDEATLAKFTGFKLLYERAFRRQYLEELPYDKLQAYAEEAVKRGSDAAKKINSRDKYKDLLVAKTEALPLPHEGQTFSAYVDEMQAFQASEMRIQKGYESDGARAKKQMEWIDNFRCDIVIRAFADFLQNHQGKLHWLLSLKPGASANQPNTEQPPASFEDNTIDNWQAALYYMLHFAPVNDVSQLLHQLKKWQASEARLEKDAKDETSQTEQVTQLIRLLALYLDMHDDKHQGEGIAVEGLEQFHEFFEGGKPAFDSVFKTEGSNDHKLATTRRGLREILRFGHFKVLKGAVDINKITANDISILKEWENIPPGKKYSKIAAVQRERKTLHQKIVRDRKPENENIEDYIDLLGEINEHKNLANKVYLHYYVKLHRIMLRVVARLIDYAGLWERDGKFIKKAMEKLHSNADDTGINEQIKRFYTIDKKQIRNDLAHFNILAQKDVNLTDEVNRVRDLMAYDRKLKNAVSKSIIDILYEEGIELKWCMNNHQLCLDTLVSREITHLGNTRVENKPKDKLKEKFHDDDFIAMVRQLFI